MVQMASSVMGNNIDAPVDETIFDMDIKEIDDDLLPDDLPAEDISDETVLKMMNISDINHKNSLNDERDQESSGWKPGIHQCCREKADGSILEVHW
ncbi:hypothetical protein GUJ93_ZPchr0009g209 [Zizania palustris]|uniref:Uncharacterized protein n=1 Tax=Zizania palustris TaxID=103762 RepID=A0A8J5VIU2_ZIZPA|nr:hypothetical protein GUJ93_ZPchr0009g209 [Zizania palustris]